MTKITLDGAVSAKFGGFVEQIEVCDEAGRTLGYFIPAGLNSAYEGAECPLSEEELARRQQETVRYSTDEVLRRLESL